MRKERKDIKKIQMGLLEIENKIPEVKKYVE